MKITRLNKAGTRQDTGVERPAKKREKDAADRVALSAAGIRRLEVKPKWSSLTPDRETEALCRKIAARIRAGDHVPPEDRRYLEQHDAAGYQLAMAMRHVKERPKHWDSAVKAAREAHKPEADGVAAVLAAQSPRSDRHPRRNSAPPKEEEEA